MLTTKHSFTCQSHVYPRMEWTILPLLPSCNASSHINQYSFLSSWG